MDVIGGSLRADSPAASGEAVTVDGTMRSLPAKGDVKNLSEGHPDWLTYREAHFD